MADLPFRKRPAGSAGGAFRPARESPGRDDTDKISCRATNPLSIQDDLEKVFLDERQAKATTATKLFRDDKLFSALAKVVLPAFFAKQRGGKFSMWSTGCSSGEEVYSLAMIALEVMTRAGRPPLVEAFGTDINRNRIMEARSGIYNKPSQSAMNPRYWRLLETFAEIGAHEAVMGETLRATCRFMLFDMRKCPKKHTFHFIVCNHVLQYYDAPGQRHIIANLKKVLRPGGVLYLEGVTDNGLAGSGLKRIPEGANLYTP